MKLSILGLVFLFFSCEKDRSCEGCNSGNDYKDAVIVYTGPVQGDGCDWVVKTGANQYYHPDILETEFKVNELNVKISYELTNDEFRCGIRASVMPVIHIRKIKR